MGPIHPANRPRLSVPRHPCLPSSQKELPTFPKRYKCPSRFITPDAKPQHQHHRCTEKVPRIRCSDKLPATTPRGRASTPATPKSPPQQQQTYSWMSRAAAARSICTVSPCRTARELRARGRRIGGSIWASTGRRPPRHARSSSSPGLAAIVLAVSPNYESQ